MLERTLGTVSPLRRRAVVRVLRVMWPATSRSNGRRRRFSAVCRGEQPAVRENVAGGKIKLKTRRKNTRKKNDGRAYIDFRRGEDSRAHTRHRPTTSAMAARGAVTTGRWCPLRAETRARVLGYNNNILSTVPLTH